MLETESPEGYNKKENYDGGNRDERMEKPE